MKLKLPKTKPKPAVHPLRAWMEATGTTRAKLAADAGVGQATLFRILTGDDLYMSTATRLVRATHGKVSLAQLADHVTPHS